MGERVDQLTPDALAADPMVQCLEQKFAQLGYAALRRDCVPVLVTCWTTSRVLSDRVGDLGLSEGALIRQSGKLYSRLMEMGGQERGEAIAGLCWEISGRVGAP